MPENPARANGPVSVIGRFAPSPSGRIHLGNVFAAWMSWLCARSAGGAFLLRIEDLDRQRCRPEYTQQLLEDLRWLGLDWEPAPLLVQSQRDSLYQEALAVLKSKALLYPCFCSRADLHAAAAPHASDGHAVYSGRCRTLLAADQAQRAAAKSPALRVCTPDTTYAFTDGLFGPQQQNPAQDWGDFVVRRADGIFAYQLAVVVDDAASGVTQVVRGWDLLSSVSPQLFLQQALGLPTPSYLHLPLLLAPDGKRLSKREKSLDMGNLRQRFASPQALLGQLAFDLGLQDRPQPLAAGELLPGFDPRRLGTAHRVIPLHCYQ